MKSNIFYVAATALLLFSCSQNKTDDKIKVEYIDTHIVASDFLDGYEAIPLGAPSTDAFIRQINRVVVTDDRVFVLDCSLSKVLAFDRQGNFIKSTSGMIGRGPNEYIQVSDIAVDKKLNKLFLQCDNPNCMIILNYDLAFESKTDMDYYCLQIAIDDNYIYGIRNPTHGKPDEQSDYLLAIDRKDIGGKPKVLLKTDNIHTQIGAGTVLTSSNGVFACGRFDNTIYQIENGEITKQYSLDFGERALPESFRTENMKPREFFDKYKDKIMRIDKVHSSDSLILFSTNQATMFVLDKSTMTCKGYKGFMNDRIPLTSTFSLPSHIDNGVIYEQDNSMWMGYISRYKEGKTTRKLDDNLMEMAENLNAESNPLIVIWKIK